MTAKSARPNILLIFVDQQRWDTLGVNGSPEGLTPNLDRLARRGTRFQLPITNQPVCAPARACLLTGQYGTTHGVWKNSIGLRDAERHAGGAAAGAGGAAGGAGVGGGNGGGLRPAAETGGYVGPPTLATELTAAGYQTGYIGKWHLASRESGPGWVPPEQRAGFQDFWEAANVLEFVSQPFETVLFDRDGKEVRPPGYRVDAMTDRAIHFLTEGRKADGREGDPFFLMISYLEPHHQNDVDQYVAPEEYTARHANPFVPHDLRALPGSWPSHLPGYYGIIENIDENVGRLLVTLEAEGLAENTIVLYTCDHGCHFKTRNAEYKRSCHDSSLRVPLVVAGPGFDRRQIVPEPVGTVDLAPTLLEAAGVPVPETMQGRSFLGLAAREAAACESWPEEAFVQISESMVGRALRSERWTYCVTAPGAGGGSVPASETYVESHLYDTYADPHQLVNLLGRRQYADVAARLRERLLERMAEAGEAAATIEPFGGNAPP